MKIPRSTLIQMIKEEMMNEDDESEWVPVKDLESQSLSDDPIEILRQINLEQPDLEQSDAAQEVHTAATALADYLENTKLGPYKASDIVGITKMKLERRGSQEEPEEETIEISEEKRTKKKWNRGDRVKHSDDDLGVGTVSSVAAGKEGTVSVRWPSGTKSHHRWSLKPAND